MRPPLVDIEACRRAHARLATVVDALDDEQFRHPSLLPGWSVAHVLAHLASNAAAMVRRTEAALRGEIVEQYPGGAAGRASLIEIGASLATPDLVAEVIGSANAAEHAFASVPDGMWDRPVRTVGGREHALAVLPYRRWREVEIHLVDLDVGVGSEGWPDALVDRMLPELLDGLAARADRCSLVAWMTGRGPAPDLDPWG